MPDKPQYAGDPVASRSYDYDSIGGRIAAAFDARSATEKMPTTL